ncbi:MAG: hypothetical protein AB1414_19640 [bacterium]
MCNLKGLKGNSRGTRIKTIMCSIAVLCVLLGSSTIAQGIEWQWPWLKGKEQKTKQEKVVKKKNLPLRPKQIGTPTVQALLDKVKANYQKIQDLEADYQWKVRDAQLTKFLGIIGDLFIQKEKFFFKAPDKLKWIPPNENRTVITKGQTQQIEYAKREIEQDKWEVYDKKLYWYYLLEPWNLPFYWRLDEIITKFDTKVIDNPQPDIWVIEAVPKASNPEDEYNYPSSNGKLEIFVDYNKGVITKIDDFSDFTGFHPDVPPGIRLTCRRETQDFESISNVWIPTKFITTKFTIPKFRPKEVKEEITLGNIQLNTDIPDSEFEF